MRADWVLIECGLGPTGLSFSALANADQHKHQHRTRVSRVWCYVWLSMGLCVLLQQGLIVTGGMELDYLHDSY